jgi:hypothetical protein
MTSVAKKSINRFLLLSTPINPIEKRIADTIR